MTTPTKQNSFFKNTYKEGHGLGGALGLSKDAIHKLNQKNKTYFEALLNCLPSAEKKHFQVLENYNAWECAVSPTTEIMTPIYKCLFELEDKIAKTNGLSVAELQKQNDFPSSLNPQNINQMSLRLKDILSGKIVIPEFSITKNQAETLIAFWWKTYERCTSTR